MTNRNSNWKSESGKFKGPIPLLPAGKDYLWGGRRLRDDFSKDIPLTPLAETWECSTHPDGLSLLAEDPDKTLHELLQENPWMFGTHPAKSMPEAVKKGELPVLIKFIDAASDLSVQVHPDDAYAREHENGQLGKSEMWYVVDAAPGAKLVYGFSHDMDRERVREHRTELSRSICSGCRSERTMFSSFRPEPFMQSAAGASSRRSRRART